MPSLFTSESNGYKYADVILPLNMPQALTYGIPEPMQESIKEGMRVEVALRGNKLFSGVVARLHNNTPDVYQVKPIKKLLDDTPIVNETQLLFWNWIMEYYMATPGEVMHAALPAHLKLSGETKLVWNEELTEKRDFLD